MIAMQQLTGSVVAITGGAGGIGVALGEAFAAEGAAVHLLDVDGRRVGEEAERLRAAGLDVTAGTVDVTDNGSVVAAVRDLLDRRGRVDTLCNNAGIADGLKTVEEVDEADWDRLFAVNVKGAFLMTRAVLPDMRSRQRGVIANIASVAGIVGGVSGAAYTASKHAVIGLTRNVATTYARAGVRCNAICPGSVDSGMPLATSGDQTLDERVARIRSTQPRRGLPAEIAGVAVFLASDAASFVNGAILDINGGRFLR